MSDRIYALMNFPVFILTYVMQIYITEAISIMKSFELPFCTSS